MCFVRASIRPLAVVAVLLGFPGVAAAQDQTSTGVTTPGAPLVHGQSTTVTATVNDTTTPATQPVGSVRFYLDGAQVGGPVVLTARTAQLQTPALRAGQHTVRAVYDPAAGFQTSEGSTALTVGRAATTTLVRITPTSAVAGQDLDAEIVVAPTTPALGAPSGGVALTVNGAPFAGDTLDADGVARGTAWLGAMSAAVRVDYQGDANYTGSSGTTTLAVGKAGTVVALSASPNPAAVNQVVTTSATVDSLAPSTWWPSGVLTGSVDGQPVPGAITIDGPGQGAALTTSFTSPGLRRLGAHFAGDMDFLDADAALVLTITGPPTNTVPLRRPQPARGLTLKASPSRDRRAPYRFALSGTLQLPGSVAQADGCSGRVTVEAKLKSRRIVRKTTTVNRACRFSTTFPVTRKGTVSVTARFDGNDSVGAASARPIKVKAG
ncbi:Ig-like domain-containing protein [Solirubrobacter taibaiensis]|nr:Ig-like domain-containing protein [Solirubrobacter taibaiensis]